MAAQSVANNLYETASQPDTGGDAYTFLEFGTQGDDFDYPEFQELSQPIRSSSSDLPAPDSLHFHPPPPLLRPHPPPLLARDGEAIDPRLSMPSQAGSAGSISKKRRGMRILGRWVSRSMRAATVACRILLASCAATCRLAASGSVTLVATLPGHIS
ncbi:hypothetical protein J5N97_025099 [Dioscorea zingiberensis]|uniref:Uncharacterized protein n=1 Tax=Dioscorea zingiberensis TaxID=325984 RepID=A0A9D5C7N5_9LILI|nr:hypothetical protein J5N97_025099 [Dioscorea zingiberensis]